MKTNNSWIFRGRVSLMAFLFVSAVCTQTSHERRNSCAHGELDR